MPRPSRSIQPLLAIAAFLALVVAVSGCGTTDADPERGRMLFKEKCGTCHAMAEAGTSGTAGPNLDHAFAAARAVGNDSDTIEGVVTAQVEYPRPSTGNSAVSMPADLVTGQDLEDVAAYVGEWAGVPGAAPPKVSGGPGAQVFANEGCGTCHTFKAAAATGTVGPNLDESIAGDPAKLVEQMIVNPNAEIAKGFPSGVMPPNYGQTLSSKELEDLVEFLLENAGGGAGQSKG